MRMKLSFFSKAFSKNVGILRIAHKKWKNKGGVGVVMKYFWKGVGIGTVAGTLLGVKLKSEEKQIKRKMHRAKRNVESAINSVGI